MKLKEFINEYAVYEKAEKEITAWVEKSYPGLSMDYSGNVPEPVRIDENVDFSEDRVPKIVEAINIKIGDILDKYKEEIYIAERLTRIWKKHPRFDIEVESIEDIKRNPKFLKYLKELIIKRPKKGVVNGTNRR